MLNYFFVLCSSPTKPTTPSRCLSPPSQLLLLYVHSTRSFNSFVFNPWAFHSFFVFESLKPSTPSMCLSLTIGNSSVRFERAQTEAFKNIETEPIHETVKPNRLQNFKPVNR